MTLLDAFRTRRKETRFILRMLALLLLCLTALFYLVLRGRDLPSTLVANRLLLFVLWYINVVLILAVLFILARSLFKLLVERRHRILGTKFKSKLLATYVGLSLVPILLLYLYGNQLLQASVERWFAAPVEEVLGEGAAVAERTFSLVEEWTSHDAKVVAEGLAGLQLDRMRQRRLDQRLQESLERQGLHFLGVYQESEFVGGVVDPEGGLRDLPEPGRAMLVGAAGGATEPRIVPAPRGDGKLVLAAAAIPDSSPAGGVLVAGRLLPPALASGATGLIDAYQGYRQLKSQEPELTASQRNIFLLATLLILLASTWVGLYLARRITVPIQALAEGTRRISGGDLSHRVDVEADDELGVLVSSFNTMTAELGQHRQLLEAGNRELSHANRELAEERALVEAVLQSVAAGVIAIDGEGRVFLCNGAALAMLRQGEAEVRDRTLREAWADPERAKLLALVELEPAPVESLQVRLVLGGDWKTFALTRMPLPAEPAGEGGAAGTAGGQVLVLEDLTELIKAQGLAAWNEAARRIAHEIKNPLTPIQLAAERVLRKHRAGGSDLGPALEEGVRIIVREVDTLKRMVDEFSRFARMPRPQPVEVDLEELVGETVRLYRGVKPGVEVAMRVAPGASHAWGDAEQLRGALINLLDNAVEATEAPGLVEVRTERCDGRLQLQVADSGRGIPPAAKEKLFLPHFSTKGRGTGLGLAIVHRIVSDHHGTIRVEDNEPQGTVFTIDLPAR